jgi:flagellar hook-length control protein FliK
MIHAHAATRAHGSSPPTSGAAPPGAPPGAPPFQSALAEQWARTATAEGHKPEHSHEEHKEHEHEHERAGIEPAAVPTAIALDAARPFGVLGRPEVPINVPTDVHRASFAARAGTARAGTARAGTARASGLMAPDPGSDAPATAATVDTKAPSTDTATAGALSRELLAGDPTAVALAAGDEAAPTASGQGVSSATTGAVTPVAAHSTDETVRSLSSSATAPTLPSTSTATASVPAADLAQVFRAASTTGDSTHSTDTTLHGDIHRSSGDANVIATATPPTDATPDGDTRSSGDANEPTGDPTAPSPGHAPTGDRSPTGDGSATGDVSKTGDRSAAGDVSRTGDRSATGDVSQTATRGAIANTSALGAVAGAATQNGAVSLSAQGATASESTRDAPTGAVVAGDRSSAPAPQTPGANQAQTPPAAVPTARPGAADARPEPGEAGSSNTTRSGDALIAVAAQPDALPARTLATSTRGASARAGALGATLAGTSSRAPDGDSGLQPFTAPLPVTQTNTAAPSLATLAAGVGMQGMIDSIRATIALAVRQGMTQARIALQPEELGEIRIHLSQTSDGLLARLTADTPAAEQMLAGARGELHHSLSSLGVSLLRLDIGSSGQSDVGGHGGWPPARSEAGNGRQGERREHRDEDSHTVHGLQDAQSTAGPARGELVDVLA